MAATRDFMGKSAWVAVCGTLLWHNALAFDLDNWRLPYCLIAKDLDGVASSPSGMFWDDLTIDTVVGRGVCLDSARAHSENWHVEPAVSAGVSNQRFVDDNRDFYTVKINSDVRYRNLFVRTVLDVDSRFLHDSSYVWKNDRFAAGRFEEAYMQSDWSFGFFRLGRLNRSWGPFLDRGLLVSSNPFSYDGIELQLSGPFFEFRDLFAAFPYAYSSIDGDGAMNNRYFSAHSLNFMVGRLGTLGISESVLFSDNTGLPDLQYVNPFTSYAVVRTNGEGTPANLMVALEWDLHPYLQNVSFKGELLIDDFQVDNKNAGDQKPNHWAIDAEASAHDVLPMRLRHSLTLNYRYLSRWVYTISDDNVAVGQRYTYLGQSLGEPRNDGDFWDLRFVLLNGRCWAGKGGLSFRRQGSNTVMTRWNDTSDSSKALGIVPNALGYRTEPVFPSGIVEQTIDPYFGALCYFGGLADIDLEAHCRWVKNKNNVTTSSFSFDPLISLTFNLHYPDFFWQF
jgi:hypothetical protein